MLVGRVIRHKVQDHLEPSCVSLRQQALEVSRRSEDGIDATVVADVISTVRHWRRINRSYPNGIHAQPAQVVQSTANTLEITDAVAIAVLE